MIWLWQKLFCLLLVHQRGEAAPRDQSWINWITNWINGIANWINRITDWGQTSGGTKKQVTTQKHPLEDEKWKSRKESKKKNQERKPRKNQEKNQEKWSDKDKEHPQMFICNCFNCDLIATTLWSGWSGVWSRQLDHKLDQKLGQRDQNRINIFPLKYWRTRKSVLRAFFNRLFVVA